MSASSPASVRTEEAVRAAVRRVADRRDDVVWCRGLSGVEVADRLGLPSGVELAGIRPDGGFFCAPDGSVLVAVEAKKQGVTGNAIERWCKNRDLARALGVSVYVTVCSGDGFFDGNSAEKIMVSSLAADPTERWRFAAGRVWNVPAGSSWLYRFRSAAEAAAFDVDTLVDAAVSAALSTFH